MIEFTCPSCGETMNVSNLSIQKVDYLACQSCNRVVPFHLLASIKTVCRYIPDSAVVDRNNPQNWLIRLK